MAIYHRYEILSDILIHLFKKYTSKYRNHGSGMINLLLIEPQIVYKTVKVWGYEELQRTKSVSHMDILQNMEAQVSGIIPVDMKTSQGAQSVL